MNAVVSVRLYFQEILKIVGSGIKAIVMDQETVSILGLAFLLSELSQNEIYILERIDSPSKDVLSFVKVIYFLRPIQENVLRICEELKSPRYGFHFIFFTNSLPQESLEKIAIADRTECVKEVQEIFCDFYPLSPYLFTTNQKTYRDKIGWVGSELKRCSDGLFSLSMALKMKPHVRYQKNSAVCRDLAINIDNRLNSGDAKLYAGDLARQSQSLLLILDRKFDPVAPLVFQWTYQAMIHELFTIRNNNLNMSSIPNIPADMKEAVLSPEHDKIFQANMFLHISDVSTNVKDLVSEYETVRKSKQKLDSISSMKAAIDNLPKIRKISAVVSRHVTIASELTRVAIQRNLKTLSEFEEAMVINDRTSTSFYTTLVNLLKQPNTSKPDAVRIAMLFHVCHPNLGKGEREEILNLLRALGVGADQIKGISSVTDYAYKQQPCVKFVNHDYKVFKNSNNCLKFPERGCDPFSGAVQPALCSIVNNIVKCNVVSHVFPLVGAHNDVPFRYNQIVIFVVGGVTYSESMFVSEFNRANPNSRILIGGTVVHNSSSFIQEVIDLA